jgi:hypothetical protein
MNRLLLDANELMSSEWHEDSLRSLLYNLENLRKRHNNEEGNEEE